MAKSTYTLDQAVADELNRVLSPRVLTLKHVTPRRPDVEGFYFVYCQGGTHYIDTVPIWQDTGGVRKKPECFIMPCAVATRLEQRAYLHWYFADGDGLHRIQTTKVERLHELFWFVLDDDPRHRSLPLLELELFYLRKKALVPMRPYTPRWNECSKLRVRPREPAIA